MASRPGFDDIWMKMAHLIAGRSIDPRSQVGSVIVNEDDTQVLALGYNGNERGGSNEVKSLEPGQSGLIHAEVNACIKLDYNNHQRKKIYVTMSPCTMCAKVIINSGIAEVVYDEEYRITDGLDILRKSGLVVRKFTPKHNT
jgi:dCMP deaminase